MKEHDRQLDLDFVGADGSVARRGLEAAGRALRGVLHWLPVVLPFVLFAQVSLLGLAPALEERARLAGEERRQTARAERLHATYGALERQARAFADPIFRERVRRARRSAGFATAPRPLALPLTPPRDRE